MIAPAPQGCGAGVRYGEGEVSWFDRLTMRKFPSP
jgi:hypothetical protein